MPTAHNETPLDPKENSHQDDRSIAEEEEDITNEKLKINRKSVVTKKAFLSELDKIKRAPTPTAISKQAPASSTVMENQPITKVVNDDLRITAAAN